MRKLPVILLFILPVVHSSAQQKAFKCGHPANMSQEVKALVIPVDKTNWDNLFNSGIIIPGSKPATTLPFNTTHQLPNFTASKNIEQGIDEKAD